MPVKKNTLQAFVYFMEETMNTFTETDDKLREIVELSRLYDIYGALLSDHNRVIFEDYVLNNYSLGEIAEEAEISRQGVRDVVVRCSKKLHDYEDSLGFMKKIDTAENYIDELKTMFECDHIESDKALYLIKKVQEALEQ